MNESHEKSFGQEFDERFERKKELNREIVKIRDGLKVLRKQKQIPEIVGEIERLAREVEKLEEELAIIESTKY